MIHVWFQTSQQTHIQYIEHFAESGAICMCAGGHMTGKKCDRMKVHIHTFWPSNKNMFLPQFQQIRPCCKPT